MSRTATSTFGPATWSDVGKAGSAAVELAPLGVLLVLARLDVLDERLQPRLQGLPDPVRLLPPAPHLQHRAARLGRVQRHQVALEVVQQRHPRRVPSPLPLPALVLLGDLLGAQERERLVEAADEVLVLAVMPAQPGAQFI